MIKPDDISVGAVVRHDRGERIDLPSPERVRQLFDYRDDGRLIWRQRDEAEFASAGVAKAWNAKWSFSIAGTGVAAGYTKVEIDGVGYVAHRLVWVWHNGPIPKDLFIDHINGDRSDNRIENLRLVSRSVNGRNRRMSNMNTSGVVGVSWNQEQRRWVARFKVLGRDIYVGRFLSLVEAETAVRHARQMHGFTERHGCAA